MPRADRRAIGLGALLNRGWSYFRGRPGILLALVAALPFFPGASQFAHRGIPDLLFTGDGGSLEIRTLHAAHGTQLLGPYSRFHWSHPGPAFFYLALPIYQAFHQHGPALNLFAFLANFACATTLVLAALRLRGPLFAFVVAILLAIYECAAAPFQLSSEWNPIVPILPLGLLSFLCARLAVGALSVLPAVAFLASAIIQTHVGFVPSVAVLLATALVLRRALPSKRAGRHPSFTKRAIVIAAVTACTLGLLWLPPLIENTTRRPGNLELLYRFFTSHHRPEHSWLTTAEVVIRELSRLPVATASLLGFANEASLPVCIGLALGQVVAVVVALASALRKRDEALIVLATIAIGEILAAAMAVRNIRGDIHPYLVEWISVVSVVSMSAIAAWILPRSVGGDFPPGRPRPGPRWPGAMAGAAMLAAAVALGQALRVQARRVDVFRSHDEMAERLARDIREYLLAAHIDHPLIRIATGDQWPTAVAVILYLYKQSFPFFVDRYWLFMMGDQFATASTDRPWLSIGDREFCDSSRGRPDFRPVAAAGDSCALLGDPNYLRDHRLPGKVSLVSATGVMRDPELAVDGIVPPDGKQWDSPLSVILSTKESSIEVAVPQANVDGLFLTADGSDVYAVSCVRSDGSSFKLGSILAGVPIGMGTGLLFSDELSSCRSARVSPERGDGYYSIGEIGFLAK